MASKRMFDKAIVDTDKFTDMPMSTKALYFLLGMEADDFGFVSPRRVMKMHGGTEDDVKILIAKGFVIQFESGVVVITHWNKHNYLDKNRIKATEYKDELAMLLMDNRVYYVAQTQTFIEINRGATSVQPVLNNGLTSVEHSMNTPYTHFSRMTENQGLTTVERPFNQYSIEEYRIEEESIVNTCAALSACADATHCHNSGLLQQQISLTEEHCHESVQTDIRHGKAVSTEGSSETVTDDVITKAEKKARRKKVQTPPSIVTEAVITITLNDKSEYPVTQEQLDMFITLYPAIDVMRELREIKAWNFANPTKRKTKGGILRHINTWLSNAQNSGGFNNRQGNLSNGGGRQYASTGGNNQQSNPYGGIKSGKF